MSTVKYVRNLRYIFQTFRKVNVANYLYKKSLKSLLGEFIYYTIPIVFFSGNILIMILNNVLHSSEDLFTYCNDFSNSLCLSVLYFISYFLSGYFPLRFDEFIANGVEENLREETKTSENGKKSYILLVIIGMILFGIGFMAGFSFYSVAKSNINAYWIYNLDNFGRIYYCVFLAVTWFHSLSLLGMALSGSFVIYFVIKSNQIVYNEMDFNKNISITSAVDVVICTFSYGLFYIIGAVLLILNDRISEKYGVYNAFHDDIASFVLIFCILILVIIEYIPLNQIIIFMNRQKHCLIAKLNESISKEQSKEQSFDKLRLLTEERNYYMEQNLISTSIANRVIFILSVLIPSIGIVIQGIELFI